MFRNVQNELSISEYSVFHDEQYSSKWIVFTTPKMYRVQLIAWKAIGKKGRIGRQLINNVK